MTESPLPLSTRLWFAFVCFVRVLFDANFAGRAYLVRERMPPEPPPPPAPEPPKLEAPGPEAPRPEPPKPEPPKPAGPGPEQGALQVLAMLQREGRFLDFLEEDVTGFSDADVGGVARQVHEGCRKAVRAALSLEPVRPEPEGQSVEVPVGYDAASVKLTGNLRGSGPFRGALRHRGWRARELRLPTLLAGGDPRVLAPAEVEI